MSENKQQHGGARPGAGRKAKEETVSTAFRLEKQAYETCKEYYGRKLNAEVNNFIKEKAKEIKGA